MNREEFIKKVDKKLENKELRLFPRMNNETNKGHTKSDKKTKTK